MQAVTEHFAGSGFKVFAGMIASDPKVEVWAIPVKGGGSRAFCDRIGVAKRDSVVDVALMEYSVREDLNRRAPRVMGVLRPLKVVIAITDENRKSVSSSLGMKTSEDTSPYYESWVSSTARDFQAALEFLDGKWTAAISATAGIASYSGEHASPDTTMRYRGTPRSSVASRA